MVTGLACTLDFCTCLLFDFVPKAWQSVGYGLPCFAVCCLHLLSVATSVPVTRLRRGTLSLLWRFGMPQEDINPHMGWAYGSVEFQKYYRLVDAV